MSRTDKTDPPYVTAEWWEPDHWGCEATGGTAACDLPALPVRQHQNRPRYGRWDRCHWEYVWPWNHGRRSYAIRGVPRCSSGTCGTARSGYGNAITYGPCATNTTRTGL